MNNKTLIFLHISKTGGTTLRSIIKNQYDNIMDLDPSYFTSDAEQYAQVYEERVLMLRDMNDAEKHKIQAIFQSGGFGIHEVLPQVCDYMTVLRDPIDHFISSYYFAVNNPGHINHQRIVEENISLEGYLDLFPNHNLQTRRLSGHDPITENKNTEPLPPEALEMAKDNLQNKVRVVGLLEEFDESLILMQQAFGWQSLQYVSRNVAPKRIAKEAVSDTLKVRIREALANDVEIYELAKKRFEEQKAQYDAQQWYKLTKDFKKAQTRYKRILPIKQNIAKLAKRVGIIKP